MGLLPSNLALRLASKALNKSQDFKIFTYFVLVTHF